MILSVGTALTGTNLERSLHARSPVTKAAGGFVQRAREEGIVIDLSRVRFAEFGAIAQVLLIAEAACREDVAVHIELPQPVATEGERLQVNANSRSRDVQQAITREIVRGVIGRRRALHFLRAVGFMAAARMPHLNHPQITLSDPDENSLTRSSLGPSMSGREASSMGRAIDDEWGEPNSIRESRILPFRWVAPTDTGQLRVSESLAAAALGLREIGLPPADAQRLADAVVHELVENVAIHAPHKADVPPPYALLGAVVLKPGTLPHWGVREELRKFNQWATESGSTVVRLLVGDSGIGLVQRLSASLPDNATFEIPIDGRPLTLAERTTLWAFHPLSTSGIARVRQRRGSRGLWRVRKVVGSYRGSVLVRSADALAGYAYAAEPAGDVVRVSGLRQMVGTLVDILVLPQARSALSAITQPVGRPSARRLHWVRVAAGQKSVRSGFNAAYDLAAGNQDIVLTFDARMADGSAHQLLLDSLVRCAELAAASAVVLVIPGIHPSIVEAAVEDFHHLSLTDDEGRAAERDVGVFLLIDRLGQSFWCGGTSETRNLLQTLASDGSIPLGRDANLDARVARFVAEYPQLISSSVATINLAVSPADALAQLQEAVAQRLRQRVEHGGRGVSRGHYRTPNLRIVKRWIDPEILLDDVVGMPTAAFLLARALLRDAPRTAGPNSSVIHVGPASRSLSQELAESAALHGSAYLMTDDFDAPSQTDEMRTDHLVVLCSDLVSTKNSIRRAVAEIAGWGAKPAAIVTALDARADDQPFQMFGTTIPVISLTRVDIGTLTGSTHDVIDIDPVLRAPMPRVAAQTEYVGWDPDRFLDACAELPGAIALGHVERWTNRHFTAYLNAPRIIDAGSPMRDQVAERIAAAVLDWRTADGRSDQNRLTVCYPGRPDSYAAQFAGLVAIRLQQVLKLSGAVRVVEVPRQVAGSRWAFPNRLDYSFPEGCDVLLIDWGSLDAVTITQLARLVADAGANSVLGVVLLSQMPAHEERAATMIRSVDGASVPDTPLQPALFEIDGEGTVERARREVPTRIRFFTGLAVSAMGRGECSLCGLVAQLRSDVERGILPGPVAVHARRLADMLAPMSREVAVGRSVDAFGVPVDAVGATAYVRLRAMLTAALRTTSARQQVADHFARLAADQASTLDILAAMRLLAAERQWLKLPPLRFTECRAAVSRVALHIALGEEPEALMRVQAIIVLASTAPEVLVSHLVDLWRASLDIADLQLHLIYQMHRILRRRPGDLPVGLDLLRDRIAACRTHVRQPRAPEEWLHDLDWLLTSVLYAVEREMVDRRALTPRQAWVSLREQHYLYQLEDHNMAGRAIIELLWQMETPPTSADELDSEASAEMWRSWRLIDAFLHNHVLPFLPPLQQALMGPFAEELLHPAERARLDRLFLPGAAGEIARLGSQLRDLLRRPPQHDRPADSGWIANWTNVVHDLQWLHQTVLARGGYGLDAADLANFLVTCPTGLVDVLERCVNEATARDARVDIRLNWPCLLDDAIDVPVFCPNDLLRDAIRQLIENVSARKHRQPGLEDARVLLEISVEFSATEAVAVFRNTGTMATERSGDGGRGLAAIKRKLSEFGGQLSRYSEPGWSFVIELRCLRWAPD